MNFASNNLLAIEVASKRYALPGAKEIYVRTSKCPHAGGIIADGFIYDSDVVTCPLHRYKLSLYNG